MELEELKNNWIILNERLEKNEVINRKIIYEMISKRTSTAHDNLLKRHLLTALLMLGMMILFLWGYITKSMPIRQEAWILLECMIFVGIYMEGILIFYLYRFDLVNDNLLLLGYRLMKYKLWMHIENTWGRAISIVGVVGFFILQKATLTLQVVPFWLFIAGLVSISFIMWKRFYKKNLQHVENGLKELEELRNESIE